MYIYVDMYNIKYIFIYVYYIYKLVPRPHTFKNGSTPLFVTSAIKMYVGQNNEYEYLYYGYAYLEGLVSLNQLSVGC